MKSLPRSKRTKVARQPTSPGDLHAPGTSTRSSAIPGRVSCRPRWRRHRRFNLLFRSISGGVMFDLMETLAYIPEEVYARRLAGAGQRARCRHGRPAGRVGRDQAEGMGGRAAKCATTHCRGRSEASCVAVSPAVVEEEARLEEAMWIESVRLIPTPLTC